MPILEAIDLECFECIKVFLENGIDPNFDYKNIFGSQGKIKLIDAAKMINEKSADYIQGYFDINHLQDTIYIQDEKDAPGFLF